MEDEAPPEEIRSVAAVAYRTLALFAVVGLAFKADRRTVLSWLSENDLWEELAPSEAAFIDMPAPSQQDITNATWLCERLIVLVWALGGVEQLPAADEMCDTAVFQRLLPPYTTVSVPEFVERAQLRSDGELIACADHLPDLHWEARNAQLNDSAPREPVDMEIIQERHHAINWVIGYGGLEWDEVTTDS